MNFHPSPSRGSRPPPEESQHAFLVDAIADSAHVIPSRYRKRLRTRYQCGQLFGTAADHVLASRNHQYGTRNRRDGPPADGIARTPDARGQRFEIAARLLGEGTEGTC